ncbi:MAG: 16S rRNA (cytosine(1402)-N(4))-methyltransferase RsmH [Patescibacteria group bacterium]
MHKPVLLREVIKYLDPTPGEDFMDATVGDGGHARAILEHTAPDGRLLGVDWDGLVIGPVRPIGPIGHKAGPRCDTGSMVRESEPPRTDSLNQRDRSGIALRSLDCSRDRSLEVSGRLVLEQGNFADIFQIAGAAGFKQVSGVLFDLGLRSEQIDESRRGFSYLKNGPLDMRFRNTQTNADYTRTCADQARTYADVLTAVGIVNEWPESELARIFKIYGEEKNAKKIARAIADTRRYKKITTTAELVGIINKSYKTNKSYGAKTLARVFQALRIAVNNELENLSRGLAGAWSLLKPQGRLAVISFHSLEDRIVKQFFKAKHQIGEGMILTRKPVVPSASEVKNNPRSRSAKLRAIAKIKYKKS